MHSMGLGDILINVYDFWAKKSMSLRKMLYKGEKMHNEIFKYEKMSKIMHRKS